MPTDLILAIGHHLLMFSLVVTLAIEVTLVRPEMTAAQVLWVARLDVAYGAFAGLILVVGFGRVFFGLKGWEFYLTNPFFWAKIVAIAVVAGLSVPPTKRIGGWRSAMRTNADFRPPSGEIRRIRRFMQIEAIVFPSIPIFAAVMARGYGL